MVSATYKCHALQNARWMTYITVLVSVSVFLWYGCLSPGSAVENIHLSRKVAVGGENRDVLFLPSYSACHLSGLCGSPVPHPFAKVFPRNGHPSLPPSSPRAVGRIMPEACSNRTMVGRNEAHFFLSSECSRWKGYKEVPTCALPSSGYNNLIVIVLLLKGGWFHIASSFPSPPFFGPFRSISLRDDYL